MDNKLKRLNVSRISPSGGSAGEGVVINDAGTECEFGTVSSAGGGGGGYTGFHDYGNIPIITDFIGSFDNSFSSANVTGDIGSFGLTGIEIGSSLLLRVTCPTGNKVTFHSDISFIGEKPDIFPSGKTGMLVVTCFNSQISGTIAGYAEQD